MNTKIVFFLVIFTVSISNIFGEVPGWDTFNGNAEYNGTTGKFSIAGVPVNLNKGYRYFWAFGDGTCAAGTINSPSGVNGSFIIDTIHQISNAIPAKAYLELTPLYDDKSRPKRFAINFPSPFPTGVTVLPPNSKKVSLFANREAVIGDEITYIINYSSFDGCDNQRATLIFNYPDSLLTFECNTSLNNLITYYDEVGNCLPGEISFNSLQVSSSRNIFIRLRVKDNTIPLSQIICSVELRLESVGNAGAMCNKLNTIISDTLLINPDKSHDPNNILSISGICLPAPNKLVYRVNFQNDGNGPCSLVVIKNFIPDYFNPSSLVMIKPENLQPSYNPDANTFTWALPTSHLKNGRLRGLNEPNFGLDFSENETKDYIEFELSFKPERHQNLKRCEVIMNQAEIVFDCNPSIVTEKFRTEFLCCKKESCDCDENIIHFAERPEGKGSEIGNSPRPGFENHQWYPTNGLEAPNAPKSNLSTPDILSYTLVSVSDAKCARDILIVNTGIPKPVSGPSFIVLEDLDYDDCCSKVKVESCAKPNVTYNYNWEYIKNGVTYHKTGAKLYLKDVTFAKLIVSDGFNQAVFYPSLNQCKSKGRKKKVVDLKF